MVVTIHPRDEKKTFLQEVMDGTPNGHRLSQCLQCGTCGGSCPNGPDMQFTPRGLFALIAAGRRADVLSSNTMWMCVSCYFCTERCPKQIPITDIMYTLKRKAIAEGFDRDTDAPALARTFTNLVQKHGRSFEFGLASRFYLQNKPLMSLIKMGPLGISMFQKGRMSLTPNKIKNIRQLQNILAKAKELGGGS